MSATCTTMRTVESFLGLHRIAVIGVSANPNDFTRTLFRELQARRYDAVPVRPGVSEVDGARCFETVLDIEPAVEGALIVTNATVTDSVLEECAAAEIRHIWLYRAMGTGAVSGGAVEFCRAHQMEVVAGECPFMFFPRPVFPHRVHRFCRRILGRLPE